MSEEARDSFRGIPVPAAPIKLGLRLDRCLMAVPSRRGYPVIIEAFERVDDHEVNGRGLLRL
jgi:hypothetical protein